MKSVRNRTTDLLTRTVFLRDKSLIVKLSVFSGLLIMFPMIIFTLISYTRFSEVLQEEAHDYNRQINEQIQFFVEGYLRDFEIETLKIINHPDTITFLKTDTFQHLHEQTVPAVRKVLENAAYSRSDIVNYTMILDDVQIIDLASTEQKQSLLQLQNEYWYNLVPPNGQSRMIVRRIPRTTGRARTSSTKNEQPVITIAKRLINPQTLQPMGMLILDVNYKRLHEVVNRVRPGHSGYLYILDDSGRYVYHPKNTKIGTMAEHSERNIHAADDYLLNRKENLFLTWSESEVLDWHFVTSIPFSELMEGANSIRNTIFLTSIVFIIIAFIMSFGLATSLINPLKRLRNFIRKVEVGDFTGKVPVVSKDEIGMLTHGFNNMVERLDTLMEEVYASKIKEIEMNLRQKETELKMLQAQINPHFLYNSLDTIRGMALERDMDDISIMAESLAQLLRYNIKEEAAKVTIKQEILIGEKYLRIQKYRFEEKLTYHFDVPEELLEKKIAKFTLQPLLENCVVHGLEPQTGHTNITIHAKTLDSNTFLLLISDTGPGIDEEQLEKITTLLKSDQNNDKVRHIGIMNVHKRIRHLFGNEYGLFITSTLTSGTTVGIKLPL
ncbi:cache domain-containing sensor histidine kinase [Bacillus sinesaloumensis]|uniref:cache domain-containing sensor histidine kinase n=1 Tax=Litchfieldia sinesaloumensis TaxID=1926280 RepID=UPI0009887B4E|nr:sensor histidine kinase [Bacillus sinesaloumensis]